MINQKQHKQLEQYKALLLCGSFNPITYAHLRILECAKDYLEQVHGYQILEGIISPVSDAYRKPDLLSAKHRFRMSELALTDSCWIRADG